MFLNLIKILFYDPDKGWVEDEIDEDELKIAEKEDPKEVRESYMSE